MSRVNSPRRRGRPPKALAGYSETKDALVRAGVVALTEKGFSATGINEILEKVGVPKGSFYHYFGSKEAYGAALIDRYALYFAKRLESFFSNQTLSPLERLKAFVASADEAMQRFDYKRGCLVGNLGQEMNALPEAFRNQLNDVFADWQRRTADCLRLAQESGEVSPAHDADQLSAFFWIGWEGAVLRAKLERRSLPLRMFAEGFFALVAR